MVINFNRSSEKNVKQTNPTPGISLFSLFFFFSNLSVLIKKNLHSKWTLGSLQLNEQKQRLFGEKIN